MKQHARLALLATLVTGPVWAQDVAVSSTTVAQAWKQDTPGFSQGTYAPLTEFVGIDVTRVGGQDALSLHLYGWGMLDLADQSAIGGKNAGDLTYGYVQYSFAKANAELKAGRITVNQGLGPVPLDGLEARTDLRYGFTVSGFVGSPVIFKNYSSNSQQAAAHQQDLMFGGRVGWRSSRLGELGLSYLQDGTSPAEASTANPLPVDYTRRQLGLDLMLTPCSFIDVAGRTVWNVAGSEVELADRNLSRIAEHDYKATAKLAETVSFTGTFVERTFHAFFAGSTLPNLFSQSEQGMFKATGASVTWGPKANLQIIADVRRSDRTEYGHSTRFGADVRYALGSAHLLAGGGYHKVNAFAVASLAPAVPVYSLSHSETRAWVLVDRGAYTASLDAIRIQYVDAGSNPNLNGKTSESAVVGSLGYQTKKHLKVSGDVTFEDSPIYQHQVTALLRAQYQFGFSAKGGK